MYETLTLSRESSKTMDNNPRILPRIFTTLHQLSSVNRYSRDHMAKRETVAEHLGFCSIFVLYISKSINRRYPDVAIDYGKLMIRTAIHDIDETVLGDISRTTKYWNNSVRAVIAETEEKAVLKISEFLDIDIFEDWKNAKDDSLEGFIIKLSDLSSVVYKVWDEVILLENKSFLRVAEELSKFLPELRKSAPQIGLVDDRVNICTPFFTKVSSELEEINNIVLDKHTELLKTHRDMLYSFPVFTK
jgi:5'-deoxynucleotidase YfbR-like HD superfamily hydrolase